MVRVLRLLAMAAVLSFSTAQAAMTAVRSEGDLDFLIMEMSMALEESRTFDLGGFVMQDKMSELLKTSNSGDFCSTWRYTYPSAKGPVTLQLEYLDSTRVLAAVLNPKLRKVPTLERRAAAEVKKRMERYKFTGMTRKEIAKAVYDDLLLRSRVIYNGSVKNPCTNLLLRNKGDMTAFSRCLFVMLMAQDIPCRLVLHRGRNWVMVQLENGDWYHLIPVRTSCDGVADSSANPLQTEAELNISDTEKFQKKYPRTPAVNNAAIPVYENMQKFWKAAEESYKSGKSAFGAVLQHYPGKREFQTSLDEYIAGGGMVPVADTYLPGREGASLYVRVMFTVEQDNNAKEDDEPAERKKKRSLLDKSKNQFRKVNKKRRSED